MFPAKLIQAAKASVIPIYFEGQNGRLFHLASKVSMTLRISLLIREFRRLSGTHDLVPHRQADLPGKSSRHRRPQGYPDPDLRRRLFDGAAAPPFLAAKLAPERRRSILRVGRSVRRRLRSLVVQQDLDIGVDAGLHGEIALEDLLLVAGDRGIAAFGENERRKGADAFADTVAGRRQDRPGRIGDRFAARFRYQLQRQLRGPVLDRRLASACRPRPGCRRESPR